jgi:hypothetical protein
MELLTLHCLARSSATVTPLTPDERYGCVCGWVGGWGRLARQPNNSAWCGACEATGVIATCPPTASIALVPVAAPSDERGSLHAPSSDPVQVPVLVRAWYPSVRRGTGFRGLGV